MDVGSSNWNGVRLEWKIKIEEISNLAANYFLKKIEINSPKPATIIEKKYKIKN